MIKDFIVVIQLIGNDFLPQLFCMNVWLGDFDRILEKLREFYYNEQRYLVVDDQVDFEALGAFF